MRPLGHNRFSSVFALSMLVLAALAVSRPAAAQWAVIDVSSIQQLIQQYEVLEQQLATLRSQLSQAEQQYAALTGQRGMQQLLSGVNRNYLPTDWDELAAVMQGTSGTYGSLAASVQGLAATNAVLGNQDLARLSPAELAELTNARELVALREAITRAALDTTSNRFNSLQQLINAIPSATDTKGALDLQARIAAEQAMLANESTKVQVLQQTLEAEQAALEQQRSEQAIADIGTLSALSPMGLPQ